MLAPGKKVANLTQEWSEKFGLSRECAVSAGIIDAHSAAIGSGLGGSGSMFLIMGTSTCHMLLSKKEVMVEGISGVVEDGIIPGLLGYEAGQVSVGDIFAWFVDNCVPNEYKNKAIKEDKSVHDILSEKAVKFKPGEIGLVSLDWWNGCRTPLVDADLTGLILGLNLRTKPEEIYRALIEGTAFGTRMIIDLFENAGISISDLKVSGGLTKNKFLLQIYADTVNLPIEVASSQLSSALGAAILGSVAGGYYESISKAIEKMVIPSKKIITPNLEKHEIYSMVYNEYRELVKIFGRNIDSPMKRIIEISNTVKTI
jgi:L-ribulokinase